MGEERSFRARLQGVASDHDNEYMMIDATIVRAHQHSADSDEAGHAFQSDAGHLFQSDAGRDSDLKPVTCGVPPLGHLG